MDNRQKIGLAIFSSFGLGVILGHNICKQTILARFEKKKMLIANGLLSAVEKAKKNDYTNEEFVAELNSELEFLKIIEA
jgi:hypothetical protein